MAKSTGRGVYQRLAETSALLPTITLGFLPWLLWSMLIFLVMSELRSSYPRLTLDLATGLVVRVAF